MLFERDATVVLFEGENRRSGMRVRAVCAPIPPILPFMKNLITNILLSALAISASFAFAACEKIAYTQNASGEKVAVTGVPAEDGSTKYLATDPATGTQTEVPASAVETQTELSATTEATVESALAVGKAQGGIIGAVSSGLLLLWGVYKSRKVNATKLTLDSVVSGVADVLQAARMAVANGQKLTEEDITALLKAAQNDAGTREAVRKLLAEQKTVAESRLSKLWVKIKNILF